MNPLQYGRAIRPVTRPGPRLSAQIASLQDHRLGMSWSARDINAMLRSAGMRGFALVQARHGAPARFLGYVLFRTMADEGEILSIAVQDGFRRRGIARTLLERTLYFMNSKRVNTVFLEVSETNRAAIAFYSRVGFEKFGTRHNYYTMNNRTIHNALVLRAEISRSLLQRIKAEKRSSGNSPSASGNYHRCWSRY